MFIRDQRFPISDGTIVAALRAGLTTAGWGTGLSGGTELPATKTRRMFTVRDDSGPVSGRVQSRRQGVNVWADSPVDALNMALDAMHIAESVLPTGTVIAATRGFTGPYNVPDEAAYVVGGKNLTHYFFSFVADVKASDT